MRLNNFFRDRTALFAVIVGVGLVGSIVTTLLFADTNTMSLADLQKLGESMVDNRLLSIQDTQEKLSKNTELLDTTVASLTSELQTDKQGLTTIRQQIAASTDPNQVRTLNGQIVTNYRIYRLVVPKMDIIVSADKLRHESNVLGARRVQLQQQVDSLKVHYPILMNQAGSYLASMQTILQAQRAAANTAINAAVALRAADYNANPNILTQQLNTQTPIQTQLKQAYDLATQAQAKITATASVKNKNIIFIMNDDMDASLVKYMPNTTSLIRDRGANFTNYYDNIGLCCPARVTILCGEYAHNSGIWGNSYPLGGYSMFHTSGKEKSTIATWLKPAGYNSALMGKYLNEYPNAGGTTDVPDNYIPPGWSSFISPVAGEAYKQFNYELNVNGTVDAKPRQRYMVDVLSDYANDFISQPHANGYFAYLAPYSPHTPYSYAVRYDNTFNDVNYPDKPNRTNIPAANITLYNNDYRKRIRAVQAVDQMVGRLYNTVKAQGQLDNTYFVFTSDNGYHMGEHNLGEGKNTEYNEDIHIPMYIAGPGIKAGTTINQVVGNVDLAATFADMGNVSAPADVDGRSLLPLAEGAQPKNWRDYILVERPDYDSNTPMQTTTTIPANGTSKAATMEPADNAASVGPQHVPPYEAIRSANYLYLEFSDGKKLLFDEQKDPYELNNLLANTNSTTPPPPSVDGVDIPALAHTVSNLKSCKGTVCSE